MKLAAVISAAVLGFALSALLGIKLVPWLHKLKFSAHFSASNWCPGSTN